MDFIPSDLVIENEYPKLVRDNIPSILVAKGLKPETRILENQEFLDYLFKKTVEESTELLYSLKKGNTLEELADLMELIETILKVKGWSKEELQGVMLEKRQKNGGFENKILMLKRP
jgi:predicted house-cleaning noncanonical NTP pyrophosphatase (MazG superfamily)